MVMITISGSPELSLQYAPTDSGCIWRLMPSFPENAPRSDWVRRILDDMVLPLWGLHGRTVYMLQFFLTFFRCSGTLYSNNFITLKTIAISSFSLKLHTITHYRTPYHTIEQLYKTLYSIVSLYLLLYKCAYSKM